MVWRFEARRSARYPSLNNSEHLRDVRVYQEGPRLVSSVQRSLLNTLTIVQQCTAVYSSVQCTVPGGTADYADFCAESCPELRDSAPEALPVLPHLDPFASELAGPLRTFTDLLHPPHFEGIQGSNASMLHLE